MDVTGIGAALRTGATIEDDTFDRIYPATHRHRSEVHWTPVDVALCVGRWFSRARNSEVLDVGAGIGKLCHVGALATNLRWTGIERDATMVRIAGRVAHALEVAERARFTQGEALQLDWSSYGAVYLFNPFSEAVYARTPDDPLTRQAAYIHEVLGVERKLLTLEPGALVATYHGFGGEMPPEMKLVESVNAHAGPVELWLRCGSATT
jgi:predicted RNA methylase